MLDRNSVKTLKLTTKPAMTPNGRPFPPTLPESTIGSTGRMHGDRIVTIPERKAKGSRTIMVLHPSADHVVQDAVHTTTIPESDLLPIAIYLNLGVLIGDAVLFLEVGGVVIIDDNHRDIPQLI